MINIIDKKDCCGCSACMHCCPKQAIKMIPDKEGFLYPKVDMNLCIDCSLCDHTCPIINKSKPNNYSMKAMITRTKDYNSLSNTSSGGFVREVCEHLIKQDYIIYGVCFDERFKVIHRRMDSINEVSKLAGSKYVQSDLGDSFMKCKEDLLTKNNVLFIGTPCQIEGLYSYLKKDYNHLLTIDMVCHGVPSPKIWEDYKKLQERNNKSEISFINFRDKSIGYRSTRMYIRFKNGKEYYASPRTDYLLKGFFAHMTNRPSCGACAFKKLHHISDFTVYDCWNPSEVIKTIDDDNRGYTNVFINTPKANALLEDITDLIEMYKVEIDDIVPEDGDMILNSAVEHSFREEFWKDYQEIGYEKSFNKYLKPSSKDYLIENSKEILNKLGILNLISKKRVQKKK